jgi:hypothetical protein
VGKIERVCSLAGMGDRPMAWGRSVRNLAGGSSAAMEPKGDQKRPRDPRCKVWRRCGPSWADFAGLVPATGGSLPPPGPR